MRIAHLISSLDLSDGGTVAALVGLAAAQASRGARVKVISTFRKSSESAAAFSLKEAGVDVVLIGPAISPLDWHPTVNRVLRSELKIAELVHIHGLWEEIQHQGAVVSRSLNIPYLITPHGMLDPWCLAQSRLKKWLYTRLRLANNLRNAAAIHFTADIERNNYPAFLKSAKSVVIPNGIDITEYSSCTEYCKFRARHQIPKSAPLILYLGRLHPKKGIDVLIAGFAKARKTCSNQQLADAILVIAGPNKNHYKAHLERLTKNSGLSDHIRFVGPLYGHEKLEAYADADIFALVSHQENFGITVLEAMATGCAILVSDQVAIHNMISEEGLGCVVSIDENNVASALIRLSSSDRNLLEMKNRAKLAAARFDWPQVADRFLRLYRELAIRGDGLNGFANS